MLSGICQLFGQLLLASGLVELTQVKRYELSPTDRRVKELADGTSQTQEGFCASSQK
jgi:hypothetical protein